MTDRGDRIVLANMRFDGRHGVHDWERAAPQPFEVDVELAVDLRPAGAADDLAQTVDYGRVFDIVRDIVETRTFLLLEAIAETIANEVFDRYALVDEITVRVRKPKVRLSGVLDYAGVEISRRRS
jgi:7,8-dihydroneopterin aldolase/epimerase/oxygenase